MTLVRKIALWLLLAGLPIQVLAAPGWACANAGHHSQGMAAAAASPAPHHHDEPAARHDHHHHAPVAMADSSAAIDAETDSQPGPLPLSGTCAACGGCCLSATAILTLPLTAALSATAHEVAPYVTPQIAHRSLDGPFRPPRTRTA